MKVLSFLLLMFVLLQIGAFLCGVADADFPHRDKNRWDYIFFASEYGERFGRWMKEPIDRPEGHPDIMNLKVFDHALTGKEMREEFKRQRREP